MDKDSSSIDIPNEEEKEATKYADHEQCSNNRDVCMLPKKFSCLCACRQVRRSSKSIETVKHHNMEEQNAT